MKIFREMDKTPLEILFIDEDKSGFVLITGYKRGNYAVLACSGEDDYEDKINKLAP